MAKSSVWKNPPSYGTYQGEPGNPDQWKTAFQFAWDLRTAASVIKQESPYSILGVPDGSSLEVVKNAFRKLIVTNHPDKGGSNEKAQKIISAYVMASSRDSSYSNPISQPQPATNNNPIIIPQLLTEIEESELDSYLDNDEFGAQEKKDGHHKTLQVKNGKIITRNKKGIAADGSIEFGNDLLSVGCDLLIDGEQIGNKFWVWDLLEFDGKDYRNLPYYSSTQISRYSELSRIVFGPSIKLLQLYTGSEKRILYNMLRAKKKEGIVFKRLLASHTTGKGMDQFKCKFYGEISVIVVEGREGKASIGMELINAQGQREFVGYCTCVLNPLPPVGSIAEIKYLYMANVGGCLYQPSFKELRDDVDTNECLTSQIKYKAKDD